LIGQALVTAPMAPVQMQLIVRSVSGLQKPRSGIISGSPSPYVVIEKVGKEDVTRFQTPVVRQSFAPLWDFACEIDSLEVGDKLQFTLMDSKSWPRSDKVLGKAFLTRNHIHSDNCKLELTLDECDTSAKLFLAAVTSDVAVHKQAGEKKDTHPGLQDTRGNAEVGSRPCLVTVVDGCDGNLKADSINHSPEVAASPDPYSSAAVSEGSPAINPLQVVGTGNQARPVLAPCLQPPIVYSYTRKVHAPISVSAQEYSRVLAGPAALRSMEVPVIAAGKDAVQIRQLPKKVQEAPTRPAKQIKITRRKVKRCC